MKHVDLPLSLQDSFHVAGFSVSGHVLESPQVNFVLTLVKV